MFEKKGAEFELLRPVENFSWVEAKLILGPKDYATGKVASRILEFTPEELRDLDFPLDCQNRPLWENMTVEYVGKEESQNREVLKKGDTLRIVAPWYQGEFLECQCQCQKPPPSPNSDGYVVVKTDQLKRV